MTANWPGGPGATWPRRLMPGDTPEDRLSLVQHAMLGRFEGELWRYHGSLHRLDVASGVLKPLSAAGYRALAPHAIVQIIPDDEGNHRIQDVAARTLTDAYNHPDVAPEIRGVRRAPWVADDGRVVTTPGYDAQSGWYLHWTGRPADPDSVSDDDVADVLAGLTDFVYETGSAGPDVVHHIALLLTPFRLMEGSPTPLGAYLAHAPDAGKSLCAKVHGRTALGEPPEQFAMPHAGEMKYTLDAVVQAELPFVWWDNIDTGSTVGGAQLDGLLTAAGRISARVVRSSTLGSGDPTRSQWVVTGNQLELKPETARRVIPVRLAPRPAWRGFRHADIEAWVLEDRHRIVSCLLRVLRSWHDAGCPAPTKVLPSYNRWSRLVGGPICMTETGRRCWLADNHRPVPEEHLAFAHLCQRWPATKAGPPMELSAKHVLAVIDRLGLDTVRSGFGTGSERSRETRCGAWLRRFERETHARPILGWRLALGSNGDSTLYHPEPAPSTRGGSGGGSVAETQSSSPPPEPTEPTEPLGEESVGDSGAPAVDVGEDQVPEVPYVPESEASTGSSRRNLAVGGSVEEAEVPPPRCSEVPAGPLRHRVWEMAERGIRVDAERWLDLVNQAEAGLSTLDDEASERRRHNLNLYAGPVLAEAAAGDGRVRATWRMQGPGRWSCLDPYLHEVTKRFDIRQAFIPADGHRFVIGDWRAAHYWIAAGLSRDPTLRTDLERGELYERTAEIMRTDRDGAKVALLSILNGSGTETLARGLGIDEPSARGHRNAWFRRYSTLRAYVRECIARRTFNTPLGRTVQVDEDRGDHAIGAWIWQAYEADALAMVLDRVRWPAVFTFFDEVILEVPEAEADEARADLERVMDHALRSVAGLQPGAPERTVKAEVRASWGRE